MMFAYNFKARMSAEKREAFGDVGGEQGEQLHQDIKVVAVMVALTVGHLLGTTKLFTSENNLFKKFHRDKGKEK